MILYQFLMTAEWDIMMDEYDDIILSLNIPPPTQAHSKLISFHSHTAPQFKDSYKTSMHCNFMTINKYTDLDWTKT